MISKHIAVFIQKKKKPTFFLTNEVLDLDIFFYFLREEKI